MTGDDLYRSMNQGSERKMPARVHRYGRWLVAPIDTLSERGRRWMVAIGSLLVFSWCALRNGDLMFAWGLPDVQFYVDMAQRRFDLVPQPFTSRPLAPLLARYLAPWMHTGVQGGFVVLASVSLFWTLAVVFWLLLRSRSPRWIMAAVAMIPFWWQLLGYAGLPDPLYTALLAALLLALEYGWMYAAAGLMLPLMVARESTSLTLLCLLVVGWRRLRPSGCLLAVGCAALGAFAVHRLSAAGLPNPEHLSGGVYMVGKLVSNSLRSVGVLPWSNVYPVLCTVPAWGMRLPLGHAISVGVCSWQPLAPMQLLWALLTTFGMLPLLFVASWRGLFPALRHGDTLLRFCLVYGSVSLLLAPALGTWYARLFGYGWPLLLVAVPRMLNFGPTDLHGERLASAGPYRCGALLVVHATICAQGDRIGTPWNVVAVVLLEVTAAALIMVQSRGPRPAPQAV